MEVKGGGGERKGEGIKGNEGKKEKRKRKRKNIKIYKIVYRTIAQ